MNEITILTAFIGGLVSFLSPCVLPLIPGLLAYLSGTSLGDNSINARSKIFLNSVFFVLGFALIFAALGWVLNTVLKNSLFPLQQLLGKIGGIIIILFGLYMLGFFEFKFLKREYKFHLNKKFSITYITSFFFGAAFAVGWTPCIGPVLGAVLTLAIIKPGLGFALLLAYALGLGLPFLLVGLFSSHAVGWIMKSGKFLKYFNIIVGILLIILGVLIFSNSLNLVANFSIFNKIFMG